MKSLIANRWYTQLSSGDESEIFNKVIPYISLVGIVGNPIFYLICKSLGYYDNLMLRIVASVLFLVLLISKRSNSILFTIYLEFVYTFTLPFLFSFFLYTNDQNIYWNLSMVFAGGAYGMLTRRPVRALLVIPLSCMLAFVFVNLSVHVTTVAYFYDSIPTILSSIGCAIVMILVKIRLKSMIFMSIAMAADSKRFEEQRKQEEMAQKIFQLQREIHAGQRLRLIAELSKGITVEIGDVLTVIKDQASLINKKITDEHRKEKIQTVIRIVENATATVSQSEIFLKQNQVKHSD